MLEKQEEVVEQMDLFVRLIFLNMQLKMHEIHFHQIHLNLLMLYMLYVDFLLMPLIVKHSIL